MNLSRIPARGALVLVSACTVLLLPPSATSRAESAKACLPVSVRSLDRTFTYSVSVEVGNVDCGLARRVIRDAANWPPGESARTAGWGCRVGDESVSWAITCRHYDRIVRAYGPIEERDPWVIAGTRLRMPVMAPTFTAGLALRDVRLRSRCDDIAWLVAKYRRGSSAKLTIFQGKPCGDLGESPGFAVGQIHGRPAMLIEFCVPAGCGRLWGDYALRWFERGVMVVILTHGVTQAELLAVARSMAVVPH